MGTTGAVTATGGLFVAGAWIGAGAGAGRTDRTVINAVAPFMDSFERRGTMASTGTTTTFVGTIGTVTVTVGSSSFEPSGSEPKLVQHFLVKISAGVAALPKPPLVRNTWGDTIQCVFEEVADAAAFALQLQEIAHDTNWVELGLPRSLSVRITLHAGPVYPCVDPVSGKATFLGTHVNRATRIEPVAEEGQIYATEAFAALSEILGEKDYVCDYVGQKQIPRQYGTVPVFTVRRAQ